MTASEGLFVLGYGSLIYKPPPHYTHRIPAVIQGFVRRFWQSSTDHRGVPGHPGRVATLLSHEDIIEKEAFVHDLQLHDGIHQIRGAEDLITLGVVYYIPPRYADEVRLYLDVREQGGYTLHEVTVHLETPAEQEEELENLLKGLPLHETSGRKILQTSVYIGTIDNDSFVGPEDIQKTAKIISHSQGPSGQNYTYLKMLHDSLKEMPMIHNQVPVVDLYLERLLNEVHLIRPKSS